MVVNAADRFTKRHDAVAAQRSENAKRALMFLASKSPQMREAIADMAKLEQAKRHSTKT